MKESVEVKTGDRVRVVLEGPVERVYAPHDFMIGVGGNANQISQLDRHVISVEKVAKPAAVGDRLTGDEICRLTEPGTVVRVRTPDVGRVVIWSLGTAGWHSNQGGSAKSTFFSPIAEFEILYLP